MWSTGQAADWADGREIKAPSRRAYRAQISRALLNEYCGVMRRGHLLERGVTRNEVRSEVRAGRWAPVGVHTLTLAGAVPTQKGQFWRAVWESGSGAVLDGAAALCAHGMTGFTVREIDMSVPLTTTRWPRVEGVVVRRRTRLEPYPTGIPRNRPELATIRAAQLARSDREAALVVCLALQQRLVATDRLALAWSSIARSARRSFIDGLLMDSIDGARALSELDFARLCRRYGLPRPDRQVVRHLPSGRVYLDVAWDCGLVVEIDGGHHAFPLAWMDDAFRANEIAIGGEVVLRIPAVGLRLAADRFMSQVLKAHHALSAGGEAAARFPRVGVAEGVTGDAFHHTQPRT